MTILVTCTCGKQYRLGSEAAGRRAKCKQCDAIIHIPLPNQATTNQATTNRVNAETVSESSSDTKLREELQQIREATQSAAARPGMLRPSRLRYVRAFPFWASIWHGLLFVFAALIYVHWIFILPALLIAFAVMLYWRRIRFKFIGGCVNPGIVLSTSPPRIAVLTNLTKGGSTAWNVIKVMSHPIHRMSTGKPKVGQRIATIADYSMSSEELPHWNDFHPIVADIVTKDKAKLTQLLNTISLEDWKELDVGLRQLPGPTPSEGVYRLYEFESLPAYVPKDDWQLGRLVTNILNSSWLTNSSQPRIDQSIMQKIASFVPQTEMATVIAVCETISAQGRGLVLTGTHLHFNLKQIGQGQIGYYELAGAMVNPSGLELCMRDGRRIVIPEGEFLSRPLRTLELFLSQLLKP